MTTLAEHVRALPQEFFDEVLEMVHTTDNELVEIGRGYKLPNQLQLNRATRAFASRLYYSGTIFLTSRSLHIAVARDLRGWLGSLTFSALIQTQEIRISCSATYLRTYRESLGVALRFLEFLSSFLNRSLAHGRDLMEYLERILHAEVWNDEKEQTKVWMSLRGIKERLDLTTP